ncbi:hypothetical protein SASPL_127286 [Salvia splendens]|uniref:Reverse transcriptase domain-containing protein n=1 Tax=Salvia splendens TaxID=180675 RepID=A0A8X8XK84_SALSN|nr:hypothetical protein SASPL_127286 [Salvia splendens]
MSVIIGPTRSSFVAGRHITDNIVIAQEAIHSMLSMKGKHGVMALKVDLEKTYDRHYANYVEWDMTDSFTPSRGLRQGFLLSPYLFVLCMERLAHGIAKSVEAEDWKPFKFYKNRMSLVAWNAVTCPIEEGGLGLRSLHLVNNAFGFDPIASSVCKKVMFWIHRWVANMRSSLSEVAVSVIPDYLMYKTMDFFVDSSGWAWDMFDQFIPFEVANIIAATAPTSAMEEDGVAFWGPSST